MPMATRTRHRRAGDVDEASSQILVEDGSPQRGPVEIMADQDIDDEMQEGEDDEEVQGITTSPPRRDGHTKM